MPAYRPRVVFGCMIFLQAAARRASPSGICLALAEQGLLELYISPAILAEVQDVMGRPQIRAKFRQLTEDVVAEFIARIERIAVRVDEVGTGITLARDPKDEPYLNLAAECQADYLVSRDRDLLEGAAPIVRTMVNLRIVDPVDFLVAVRLEIGENSELESGLAREGEGGLAGGSAIDEFDGVDAALNRNRHPHADKLRDERFQCRINPSSLAILRSSAGRLAFAEPVCRSNR